MGIYKPFIENSFNKIDSLIDLDFELIDNNNGSLIDIYASGPDPNSNTLGEAFAWEKHVEIEFKVYEDIRDNYITIIHEIGHSLGLEHPNGNGDNPDFDISATMMSYNDNADLQDIWFSQADIYTLQKIWGKENDHEINTSNIASSRKERLILESESLKSLNIDSSLKENGISDKSFISNSSDLITSNINNSINDLSKNIFNSNVDNQS